MLGEMMGMQAGGSTLSYGGATTETQSLDDIYRMMGMQPISEQREGFESQYTYDPSREGVIFEDYGRSILGATQSGRQNLMGAGQQMQQSQAKSGFAGGGAGQQAQSQARDTIMQDFLAQEGAAKSALFKGVRGEREDWMTDVGAGLGRLQGLEGTEDYTGTSTGINSPSIDNDCYADCIEGGGNSTSCTSECADDGTTTTTTTTTQSCAQQGLYDCNGVCVDSSMDCEG
jgi:hypothetical protein